MEKKAGKPKRKSNRILSTFFKPSLGELAAYQANTAVKENSFLEKFYRNIYALFSLFLLRKAHKYGKENLIVRLEETGRDKAGGG